MYYICEIYVKCETNKLKLKDLFLLQQSLAICPGLLAT